MRRAVFLGVGLLELAAAVLLVLISVKIPGRSEVEKGVTRLRDNQDQVLGSVAQGMEAWANALDPAMIRQMKEGTAQLAGFLQDQVAPAAASASGRLEKAVETFQKDAALLSQILTDAPPDLKGAREMYESLGRFAESVERVSFLVSAERLKTLRDGFKGMEDSLDTGAEQIERLAGFTYPVVKFNGLKPQIDEKAFWPDGEDIAKGMRKGAKALHEAGKEFDTQARNLPHVQRSLDESKLAVGRMREMLGKAVNNQEKLETVLKTLPRNTARLAEELPLLAKDLNRILRETERLSEISKGLKQAETLLAGAEQSWPAARQGLLDSAGRLRTMQQAEPEVAGDVVEVLTLARWLLWVLAAIAALHATYVLGSAASAVAKPGTR